MREAEAFIRQCRSDLRVFDELSARRENSIPECHPLHYLQMATEKLAKASFLATGHQLQSRGTHVVFSKLPNILKRSDLAETLGWRRFDGYCRFLDGIGPLARRIEQLNPAIAPSQMEGAAFAQPNVEYPWYGRDASGEKTWHAPAAHSFGLLAEMQLTRNGANLMKFIRLLANRFEVMFGIGA